MTIKETEEALAKIGKTRPGSEEYNKKLTKYNKWSKWETHGGPTGPGVESILNKFQLEKALAYGDPLIEIKFSRGKYNASGQIQIIKDAQQRKEEAMFYLWLQFQDVILKRWWGNRIGQNEKRKRKLGHNENLWQEWISICWADLFNLPHYFKAKEIAGVSALDGFDVKKGEPVAALSNLANRFGLLLGNSASALNEDEVTKGMTKTPFYTNEELEEKEYSEGIQYKDRRWNGKAVRWYTAKENTDPDYQEYMEKKQEEGHLVYEGFHQKSTEEEAFENILRNSKETETFLKKFEFAFSSSEIVKGIPNIYQALLYAFGEPLKENEKGVDVVANTLTDICKIFPKKDSFKIKSFLNSLPDFLTSFGIYNEDFMKYSKDHIIMSKMKDILKKM
jgi:hypothetical protein